MTFAQALKEIRLMAGLTQRELAQQLHLARSTITAWESGHALPLPSNEKAIENLETLFGNNEKIKKVAEIYLTCKLSRQERGGRARRFARDTTRLDGGTGL